MIRMLFTGAFALLLLFPAVGIAQNDLADIRAELEELDNSPEKVQKLITASKTLQADHPTVAFGYARQAVTMAASLRLKTLRGTALSNVGYLYFQGKQYDRAISHLEQTVEWRTQNLTSNRTHFLDLAVDYRMLGNSYEAQGNLDKAYTIYKSGAAAATRGNYPKEIAYCYNRMGEIQIKQQNFQRGLAHFNDALVYAKKGSSSSLRRTVEKNQGTAVVLLQNYLEKQEIQMEVEEVQEQIEGVRDSLTSQQDSNKILISTTNLLTMERKKDSAEKKAIQLEVENRDAKIAAQEAKEDTFYLGAIAGGAIAILIISFLIYGVRSRNKAKKAVEAEKHKTEELLFSILPTQIAKELLEKKSVKSQTYDNVSILFTDFKGFTNTAEALGADQLIEELNYVFAAFDKIIEKYGLEKIKTIGDAYMAVAGVPNDHPDHALATVAAGLDMQTFMHKWKVEKELRGEKPWELRVGINSGKVVAGVIGTKKFAYDVWGDAVNTAARMEASGEPWEVNISEETFQQIRGRASCMARGPLPVKNKGSIPMYFVKQITSLEKMDTKPVTSAPMTPWWNN